MSAKKPAKNSERLTYRLSRALIRCVLRILFGYRRHFEAQPGPEGALIFASNHLSYLDPPTVGSGIAREIHFLAKKELFENRFFGALIRYYNAVPVHRGRMDWQAVARFKSFLQEGRAVIIFPEGTRSRDGKLGRAKFGLGMLAQETGAAIIPVYVRGTDRLKEAALRRRPIRVWYGKPIPPQEYAGFDPNPQGQLALSEMVMDRIRELRDLHDPRPGS